MKGVKWYYVLFYLFTVISCHNSLKENDANQDTTIHYFFDTTASLGTEVIVDYRKGIPICSSTLIQEDMKSTIIIYYLLNDSILAEQIVSYYNLPLSTRNDLHISGIWEGLCDSVSFHDYILNYDGIIIWQDNPSIAINNIFPKIKPLLRR